MEQIQINLLLAVSGTDEGIIDTVRSCFYEEGIDLVRCECRTGKNMIIQYLTANPDTTAVIISQYQGSQGSAEYTPEEIDEISMMIPHQRVIIILDDDKRGSEYIKNLVGLGIYTAVFEKDALFSEIAKLVKNGRAKKDARAYYGISGKDVIKKETFDTKNAVYFLTKYNGTVEDMTQRLATLSEKLTATNIMDVIAALPTETFNMVSRIEQYRSVCDIVKENSNSTSENTGHIERVSKSPLKKSNTRPAALDMIHVPIEKKVTEIGFISINIGVGCTFNAIMCAHALTDKNKRIAIIEFDNIDNNFQTLCRSVTNEVNISGLYTFRVRDVDYYFNTSYSQFCTQFRAIYDIVIYDFGCCNDEIIESYFIGLPFKFVVGDANEWHYGELAEFDDTLKQRKIDQDINYLIPSADNSNIGYIKDLLPGCKILPIGIERNPFYPSKKTVTLFREVFTNTYKEKKYETISTLLRIGSKPKLKKEIILISLSLSFLVLVILSMIVGNFRDSKNTDLLSQKYIQSANEMQKDYTLLKSNLIGLQQEMYEMDLEVCVLNQSVLPGELITDEMIDIIKIKTSIDQSLYLSKDRIGSIVACVDIDKGVPLYNMMFAVPIETEIPLELLQIQGFQNSME